MPACDFCKVDSKTRLKRCICKKASYCSKECQINDWRNHKHSCPPFTIRDFPGKGRGLFATRRIKEGQIILEEYPLFTFSFASFSLHEFTTKIYTNLGEETKATIFKLNDPVDIFEFRGKNDNCFEDYLNHQFKQLLMEKCSEEMTKILRIMIGNRINICPDPDLYRNHTQAGLFANISLINHSCLPNAVDSWVMGDFKRHQVRALRDIEKDEEILVSHWQSWAQFQWGSREFRRQELLEDRGFLCECSECSLEGEELQDRERMRAEIREKKAEMSQLLRDGWSRRDVKKAMKVVQQRVNLVQKLNIRYMFASAMVDFYVAATDAKNLGISAPDPEKFKQEALKYAKKYGDALTYYCNKAFQ